MNANKRELKDFLLPRSSRKARRKTKDGTTEITESHGRKDEKENWPWILKSNCKRFFATEGAEVTEESKRFVIVQKFVVWFGEARKAVVYVPPQN